MLERDDLSDAERLVFDRVESGEPADVEDADVRPELIVQLATSERSRRVYVRDAHFPGPLDLTALTLACPLALEGCRFDGGVVADDTVVASLSLRDCALTELRADPISVRGNLDLRGLHAVGVSLARSRVGGELRLAGANIAGDGIVFDGTRMRVDKSFVADGLQIHGTLELVAAEIGGQLNLDGAILRNPGADAIVANGCQVDSLRADGIRVDGGLSLIDLQARREVWLNDATLTRTGGVALLADNLRAGLNVFLQRIEVDGMLRLDRASIGVSLVLVGAKLRNAKSVALHGADVQIGQNVFLDDCEIRGDVNLSGARIDGVLDIEHTTFAEGDRLDLRDTHIGRLADHVWPEGEALESKTRPYAPMLAGLEYTSLVAGAADVPARLDWVQHAEASYVPQAFDQLAQALRRLGQEEDAREVAIAKQRRRGAQLHGAARAWNRFFDVTVGYGYRTWRAIYALLAIIAVGWGVFAWAWWDHMTPLKSPEQLPQFAPWLYSIDAVLPVVSLGQEGAWGPTGAALYWYAFSVLSGWILGTALIAAVTSRLGRG
jgi:hypothetical protein